MATKAKAKTSPKKIVKKPVVTKRVATKKSVKKSTSEPAFFEMKFTDQTVYWLIFGAVAIIFAIWLYSLDAKVRDLYDQVDTNTYNTQTVPDVKPKKS